LKPIKYIKRIEERLERPKEESGEALCSNSRSSLLLSAIVSDEQRLQRLGLQLNFVVLGF
jgi:hypothetical protein